MSTTGSGRQCFLFPPICLAVGTLPESSYEVSGRHGAAHDGDDDEDDDDEEEREDNLRFRRDNGEYDDDDDEPMPGYAFVDSYDEDEAKDVPGLEGLGCGDLTVDGKERVHREQGAGRHMSALEIEEEAEDEISFAGGSASTRGDAQRSNAATRADGTAVEIGVWNRPFRDESLTDRQLVELMAGMRESREQLAQEQRDPSPAAPTETKPALPPTTSTRDALVRGPNRSRTRAGPPSLPVLRPASGWGRSASAFLYPNVVAALGTGGTTWDRHDPCGTQVGAPADSDDDDDEDESNDLIQDGIGKRTKVVFEIWRVHAYCDRDGMNGNVGDLCFQMWRATTDTASRLQEECTGKHDHRRFKGQPSGLFDHAVEADHMNGDGGGGTVAVRSDARMMTRHVPVVCDWIRQVRSNNYSACDKRVIILSTAEDATARNHPSYHVVSNLILNPDGSNQERVERPSTKPVESEPINNSSHGLRTPWPISKVGMTPADSLAGTWMFDAVPHSGLADTKERPHPVLDRLRCWKRRRSGAVEASTDVSSSATVASF